MSECVFREFAAWHSVYAIAAGLNAEGIETLQGWERMAHGHQLRCVPW